MDQVENTRTVPGGLEPVKIDSSTTDDFFLTALEPWVKAFCVRTGLRSSFVRIKLIVKHGKVVEIRLDDYPLIKTSK